MGATAIHIDNGAAYYDATGRASTEEIQSGLEIAKGIRKKILAHFDRFPQSRIAPSEFKQLYGLPNPIHSIRPRFNKLEEDMEVVATEEEIISPYGRPEHRYRKFVAPGEQIDMF